MGRAVRRQLRSRQGCPWSFTSRRVLDGASTPLPEAEETWGTKTGARRWCSVTGRSPPLAPTASAGVGEARVHGGLARWEKSSRLQRGK